jgi:tRNA threonylcarbamoyladenosine biosynthesis protein TsaB
MKVLGLETSGVAGGVALVEGEELRAEVYLSVEETHSERLLLCVDWVLRVVGLGPADLEGVAVGLGPGSFTGLRIALSTAKGLAMALGTPLVGIPTLEALAHNVRLREGTICAMLDARRERVYGALFEAEGDLGLRRVTKEAVREVVPWVSSFRKNTVFVGSGAALYGETIRNILGADAQFPPAELLHPRGGVIARLGRERLLARGGDDVDKIIPLYLQASAAQGIGCSKNEPSVGQEPTHTWGKQLTVEP